ncbi:tripartite tricarboxylate transporter substrate binding protein [uncultured Pigmentiphaga sp.]|uniref:Bug family tripartite tricarboxylate transporter substrate binding protein n=1 Tax=uncultured Pigmentiphaga sp. TaxID=340361 RepID=UPI0026231279|nr:tripartite tricarboxylate transporter substrate binding protein [uncultured Pigmentiphaga sp.]
MKSKIFVAAFLGVSLAASSAIRAEYPERPINLVVPFPPAGTADNMARAIQPALQRALKQTVVVVNRAGAGGAIGVSHVASAPPDGYTILYSLLSVASLPDQAIVNKQKPPFTLDQLTPIAMLSAEPVAMVVPANSPYKSFSELIAAAKAKPDTLTYGSTGFFGEVHVRTAAFADVAQIKVRHIPYQGGGPLVNAMLAEEVDFALLSRALSLSQVKAGRLRYLATAGDEPWADPPGLPRMKDGGVDFDSVAGTAIFIPSGTPEAIEKKIRQAVAEAAHDPEFKKAVSSMGGQVKYFDGEQFAKFWASYVKSISAITRRIAATETWEAPK